MATLNFAATDRKVFTPVSTALSNLSNGAGTIIALARKAGTGGTGNTDFAGLLNSGTAFYRSLTQQSGPAKVADDDGTVYNASTTTGIDSSTDWVWYAVDWAAGGASLDRFHWRDHSTSGAWTHDPATGNNGGTKAGPGTGGWFRIGFLGDEAGTGKEMAVVAVWAGTRFADADYGSWTKTSDLYSHAKGAPTFLCELTATTPVDLIAGSTYSSGNSSGTALTGANPPSWTFDGVGAPVVTGNKLKRWMY